MTLLYFLKSRDNGNYPAPHQFAYLDEDGFPKAPKKKRRKSPQDARDELRRYQDLEDEELLLLLGEFDD